MFEFMNSSNFKGGLLDPKASAFPMALLQFGSGILSADPGRGMSHAFGRGAQQFGQAYQNFERQKLMQQQFKMNQLKMAQMKQVAEFREKFRNADDATRKRMIMEQPDTFKQMMVIDKQMENRTKLAHLRNRLGWGRDEANRAFRRSEAEKRRRYDEDRRDEDREWERERDQNKAARRWWENETAREDRRENAEARKEAAVALAKQRHKWAQDDIRLRSEIRKRYRDERDRAKYTTRLDAYRALRKKVEEYVASGKMSLENGKKIIDGMRDKLFTKNSLTLDFNSLMGTDAPRK